MLPDYSPMYRELQGAAVCNRRLNAVGDCKSPLLDAARRSKLD
jgi:hypothetical protein